MTHHREQGSARTLTGEWRFPAQMLDDQSYDGHASVHDANTAASLGLAGAPIEGPTHFSQFDPLAEQLWERTWFETGTISAHFQTMVVEGEQVQASMTSTGTTTATIEAHKTDGTPVLVGTASIGSDHPPSELDRRRADRKDPGELFIIDRLSIGQTSSVGEAVTMTRNDPNGPLYPFSLEQKLQRITESLPAYTVDGGAASPWGRAIVPFEMICVLAMKSGTTFAVRTPSLGLFLDLEISLHAGPVFVDQPYRIAREIVGLGQSRKTESYWTKTTLTDDTTGIHVASVMLHSGVFKATYPGYPADR